ncbi:hypothetical protein D3C71_1811430 [compost metagenome]
MDSMSALAKFSVTGSPGRMLDVAVLTAVCAWMLPVAPASKRLAAIECRANRTLFCVRFFINSVIQVARHQMGAIHIHRSLEGKSEAIQGRVHLAHR